MEIVALVSTFSTDGTQPDHRSSIDIFLPTCLRIDTLTSNYEATMGTRPGSPESFYLFLLTRHIGDINLSFFFVHVVFCLSSFVLCLFAFLIDSPVFLFAMFRLESVQEPVCFRLSVRQPTCTVQVRFLPCGYIYLFCFLS